MERTFAWAHIPLMTPHVRTHQRSRKASTLELVPGIVLCTALSALAFGLAAFEERVFGRVWLDALPLAIIMGVVVCTALPIARTMRAGICFTAKPLLELAVVLLGALIDPAAVLAAGPGLMIGVASVVVLSVPLGYGIARSFGLNSRMAALVAVGNSICGNSAIAAAAPVIGARGEEVAASIAFTAVLGVAAVLLLPVLVPLMGFSETDYGIFAGLTVYAVPQVLAATAPVSALSLEVGTLVKLMRVLMLGPVLLALAIAARRGGRSGQVSAGHMVPWFIIGFVVVVAARSAGLIPEPALPAISAAVSVLTVLSMAALGLGANMRALVPVGGRVLGSAVAGLLVLSALSLLLIRLLGLT